MPILPHYAKGAPTLASAKKSSILSGIGSAANDALKKSLEAFNGINSGSNSGGGSGSGSSSASQRSYSGGGGGGGYEAMANFSDPYGDALNDLNATNAQMLALMRQNYDNAVGSINAQYDYTQQTQEKDSAKALREAYVNYMMSNRNIGNDMNRAGVNGGVAESTRAKMYNNYGNNRNAIRTNLQDKLAEINLARNSALAQAQADYNNAMINQALTFYNQKNALRNQYM